MGRKGANCDADVTTIVLGEAIARMEEDTRQRFRMVEVGVYSMRW